MKYINDKLPEIIEEVGEPISIEIPSHDHSRSWLLERMGQGDVPDVILSHASDFAVLEKRELKEVFSEIAGEYAQKNPVESQYKLYEDANKLFYPIFNVPMVMFYNKRLVSEEALSHSWKDLLNEKWKIIFPNQHTPISKVVMAYFKKNHASEYERLKERVVFGKSPVEVIHAVARGDYHIGISNLSFSMMARQKKLEINHAVEGPIFLPEVLVFKKNSDPKLTKIADLLTQDGFQDYLGQQGFMPLHCPSKMDILEGDGWKKNWNGWDDFLRELRELDG